MTPIKCPNCRLSLPQSWSGMNDPNSKCPYCGKALSGKPLGATQTGQSSQSAEPAASPPPAAQAAGRPAGGAKTILWGVGVPIPGMPPKPSTDPASAPSARPAAAVKPAESAPRPAELPRPVAAPAQGFSTAATVNRSFADVPPLSGESAPATDNESLDVDISGSFDPQAGGPTTNAKPAPTVMFDRSSAVAPAFAKEVAALDSQLRAPTDDAAPEADQDEDAVSRPVKSKAKGKQAGKKGHRASAPARWGNAGAEEDDEAKDAPASSKKGLIIGGVAAAVVILAAVAAFALRGGKKTEDSVEPAKPAAESVPAKAEPAAEEPALAAKPTPEPAKPVEPVRPAAAVRAEKPAPSEKPARAEKPAAEKTAHAEKATRDEKALPSEKPQPTDKARPALEEAESKTGNKPSEADFKAANDAYQRGNAKLFKGNTTDAIKEFNEALRLNPRDPAIHRGLGLAYAQSGNSAEAIKHLKSYLKAAPKANDKAMVEKRIDQLQHAK